MSMNYLNRNADDDDGSTFDIREWIGKGLSWSGYLAGSQKNVDRMVRIYDSLTLPDNFISYFRSIGPFNIVCIAEDWCPDCVQNVPLIVRLAEFLPMTDLKIFFRDRNEDLMSHFLTNGKKVIPAVVFFDKTFDQLGLWAGPSRKAKAWTIDTLIKGRKANEIPPEEMDSVGRLYDEKFLKEFISDSLAEIKDCLAKP